MIVLYSVNFDKSFPFAFHISTGLFIVASMIMILCLVIIIRFRKMYRSLYDREELFNSLSTNLDDIHLIYRMDSSMIEYVSPNLERLYGISVRRFKRNPIQIMNLIGTAFREELSSYFTTIPLTTNRVIEFEMFNPVQKKLVTLVARIYPVFHKQDLIRYILSVSDITKEKETQQVLRDALMNAQQANEAKKEFLSYISHEIRTPLNVIHGMALIGIKSLEDGHKVENCLQKISDSSQKLIHLVTNILDMSKIDSNKLILSQEPFLLDRLLIEISDFYNTQAEINRLKFSLDMKNIAHNHLLGDTLRLNQILSNCISNALKFTPSGGYIRLEVEEQEGYGNQAIFCFTITDTGKGMSEDYLEKLFLPYEQEDSSIASKYGGTGLGMSITKNLVTLMAGSIQVSSKPGQGTAITIHIPFERYGDATLPYKNDKPNISDLPKQSHKDYDFTGCRILVAEDNEVNIEVICEFLKYVGIRVDIAKNGKEALRLFEASSSGFYQMILMDIHMPDQNGYDTAKQIRDSGHTDADRICIVAMSADSFAEDSARSLESGMNYHIPKPIDVNQLYQFIDQILNANVNQGKA